LTSEDAENLTKPANKNCCVSTTIMDNKFIERLMKTFRIVTLLLVILSVTVASASVIGLPITGFYPGIIILLLLTIIPIASHFYAKKIISKSNVFQRNYYITLTIINLLTMLVVL
jgi:uncharacterized membrane protein